MADLRAAQRRLLGSYSRSRRTVLALFDADVECGIEIDPQTTVPDWSGERPDYDHILWVMNQHPADAELVS